MNLAFFKPLNGEELKNEFVLLVEELILTEKLLPGDRLPSERELAEHYRVSRPLIHEGFLLLESRGLVTMRPRHGVVVNDYRKQAGLEVLLSLLEGPDSSSGSVHGPGENIHSDLEHFRAYMEKDIVLLICRRFAKQQIELKTLESANQKMSDEKASDLLAELDFTFHLELALLSGNALYPLLMNTLKPAYSRYLGKFYKSVANRDKAVEYHEKLIAAIKKKETEKAIDLIVTLDSYSSYK